MKTSWYIKNVSNKRVQLLHLTYDDESKDLEIKDAETNSKIVLFVENLKEFKDQFDKISGLISKIDPSNDNKLKKMFLDGVTKTNIAKAFDRGPGSILARLKRLKLIDDEDVSELIEE